MLSGEKKWGYRAFLFLLLLVSLFCFNNGSRSGVAHCYIMIHGRKMLLVGWLLCVLGLTCYCVCVH